MVAPLCPLWPKFRVYSFKSVVINYCLFVSFVSFVVNLPKMQNEPKTNPNEPNFLEVKAHSKPKNGAYRQIQENLFYAKRTQWYVIAIQITVEYDLLKKAKNAKQSQS